VGLDRRTIVEICQVIHAGIASWANTFRLCLIIILMTASVCTVIISMKE
jgi:hypothetical protein